MKKILIHDATLSKYSSFKDLIEMGTGAEVDQVPYIPDALKSLDDIKYHLAIVEPYQGGAGSDKTRSQLLSLIEKINKKKIPLMIRSAVKQENLESYLGLKEGKHYNPDLHFLKVHAVSEMIPTIQKILQEA